MKLTDFHNHLLPAVDDGSATLGESLAHLRAFAADGVERIYLTPHLLVQVLDDRRIAAVLRGHRAAFEALRAHLPDSEAGSLPQLMPGAEILAPSGADLARVADRPDVGLGGGEWLLVELGFDGNQDAPDVIAAAHAAGRRIIIAHPERYRYGRDEDVIGTLSRWRDAGAVLQVNVGSLTGLSGSRAHRLAWQMIDASIAGLVATDNHGDVRPHRLGEARSVLERHGGPELVEAMLRGRPRELVPGLLPGDLAARRTA